MAEHAEHRERAAPLPEELIGAMCLRLAAASPTQVAEAERLVAVCSKGLDTDVVEACEQEAASRLDRRSV